MSKLTPVTGAKNIPREISARDSAVRRLTPQCGAQNFGVKSFLVLANLRRIRCDLTVRRRRHVHVDVRLATATRRTSRIRTAGAGSESERQKRFLFLLQRIKFRRYRLSILKRTKKNDVNDLRGRKRTNWLNCSNCDIRLRLKSAARSRVTDRKYSGGSTGG